MQRSMSGSSFYDYGADRSFGRTPPATPGLRKSPSALLCDARPTTDAFRLARPYYTSTHDEHSWHGERKPLGLPRLHSANPVFQSSFSVSAYKSGSLKPSKQDTFADNTVTKFADAHPTAFQMELAHTGYRNMQDTWSNHVRSMNELQLTPIKMRNISPHY